MTFHWTSIGTVVVLLSVLISASMSLFSAISLRRRSSKRAILTRAEMEDDIARSGVLKLTMHVDPSVIRYIPNGPSASATSIKNERIDLTILESKTPTKTLLVANG